MVEVAQEVPWIDPRCRVASALAPVAQWAARSRSEAALRRVALEIAKHGPEWDALRPLGLRARAVLGAEPSDRGDAGQTRAGA
ncbi:MAG: hypothetical protein JNK11_03110 [Alphaproteobacteria bacterium]|nr:hypothetical protein [Alphaproteobacteria bacterium]